MKRIRQIVVALIGLLYVALLYPLYADLWHSKWLLQMNNECEPMFLSFFIPLGFFLLLAARKPVEYRLVILFAAWHGLAHSATMAVQTIEAYTHGVRRDYMDVIITAVVGVVLLVLLPPKREAESPACGPLKRAST